MLVFVSHQGYKFLASIAGTEAAWFYVLRGFSGFVLFLMLSIVLLPKHIDAAPWIAWGAMEEGLTAICRLAVGINNSPASRSQCNAVTGLPVDEITLVVVLYVLLRKQGK